MTVSATSIETSTASAYESTSGWKNEPDSPWRKKTGTIATTLITVA